MTDNRNRRNKMSLVILKKGELKKKYKEKLIEIEKKCRD